MCSPTRIPGEFFALSWRFFALLTLLFVAGGYGHAQTFQDVCPHAGSGLFLTGQLPLDRTFEKDWQKDYPMLIFSMSGVVDSLQHPKDIQAAADAEAAKEIAQANVDNAKTDADKAQLQGPLNTAIFNKNKADDVVKNFKSPTDHSGQLYWKEPNTDTLIRLNNPIFVPRVYTTEKLLVLVCKAQFGDSSDVSDTAVTVNVGDSGPESLPMAQVRGKETMDRVYVLDPSKTSNNSIERVLITLKPDGSSPADTLATALIERHKVIHYSAGGGLLLIRGTQHTYSNITVPSVLTTTTSVNTTVTTNGVVTSTTASSTTATAAGTFTNVFGQVGSPIQVTDVVGATWYPLGRDTYPVSWRHGMAVPYGFYNPMRSLGLFLGTSVSSLGNFTVGPTYEPFLGIQLYAGTTWWNKNSLLPNVIACSGYGNSPAFTVAPSSTNTSTSSNTASGTTTVTTTVTTISTSATSGCANGDKATIVTGTTPPTQSNLKPAFSFGILFNTNLFKSFSGLK
jgi:hypothetical protein